MKSSRICREPYGWLSRFLGIIALAIVFGGTSRAIDPNRTMSQYVRGAWGIDSGFPRGSVYSIAQTNDGYLWIGTERGLVRFDGLNFYLIQSAAPELPSLSHVLGLLSDTDGSLWLRLRRPGLTLLRYDSGIFGNAMGDLATRASVSAMTRGRDGTPAFCLLEGKSNAVVLLNKKFEKLASGVDLSASSVAAIAQTGNGEIWLGTSDVGLFRIHDGQASAVREGLPDLKVNALVPIGENELWVGTDSGIVRWDGAHLTGAGVPQVLKGVQALAMTTDRDSNLWIGTNSKGLVRLNTQGVAFLDNSHSGPSGAVTAVFEDREGDIWFGGANGIERLRDSPFITYSTLEGLPSDGSPVHVDSDNRMWFAPVTGGLWWAKAGQSGRITTAGLDKDVVYSIAERGRELWLGRQHGGLTQLNVDHGSLRAKSYTQRDGLGQDSVDSVSVARDGSVWAGTLSGGVSIFRDGRFKTYTAADGLRSNTISSILETSDGAMWFATPEGLSSLKDGRWVSFTTEQGLPSNDVNCLLEDSAGILWIGTTAGLAFRRDKQIQVSGGAPASLHEQILGIADDKLGSLWVTTSNHVLRVNRENLLHSALADGDVRDYGIADGLRGVEGVRRSRSVVTDTAGRIWLSLNRGISVVDPARLRSNSAPAIPHIQRIVADGRPIPFERNTRIPGGRQRIVFSFTGLSLAVPERVRFRYRLDGFDSDWSEPVPAREAVYTNLSPRAYRFRITASNPDGVWSTNEAAIPFQVEPLFWQTWWFRLSLIAFCMAGILALYRFRLRQVTNQLSLRFQERLTERGRIAQELHDTLLQGFLSASMQVHVAADSLPADSQAKATLTRALELMQQVIEEGRNAVRGLRSTESPSLNLEDAFARIQQEVGPQPQNAVQAAFRVIVQGEPRPLQPVLRDEVYRIGREALINAFRHARAKNIEMELNYASKRLSMLVRDDGRGIDPKILSSGKDGHWGLSGMRERADRIGAQLHVMTSASAGTEIELSVPGNIAFQSDPSPMLTWFGKRTRRNAAVQKGTGK